MFSLRVSPDSMEVCLECEEGTEAGSIPANEVYQGLTDLGVANIPPVETLAALLSSSPSPNGVVLLRGQPPVPPEPGRIEWAQDFFQDGFVTDDDGCVDFRRQAAVRSVLADQLLARIIPPKEGRSGINVFGAKAPAAPLPKRRRLVSGQNVRHDEDTDTYYAKTNGRIRWAGGVLAVDPLYTISGSVGLATGHIHHPGALVVEKDVESGSVVEVEGDIEVHGTIEAAEVRCRGSLYVRGGIIGAPGKKVVVDGTVRAKFVRDAYIEAGGDIVVEKEAIQSTLNARGSVRSPKARFIGGEVLAQGSVEVFHAGCEALIPTVLSAGCDSTTSSSAEQQKYLRRMAELQELEGRIRAAVATLKEQEASLSPAKREAIQVLLFKVDEIEQELREVRDAMAEFDLQTAARRKSRVLVHGTLFPEVVLRLCDLRLRVESPWKGPVNAINTGEDVLICPAHGWSAA